MLGLCFRRSRRLGLPVDVALGRLVLQQHQVPSRQHGNNAVQGSSTVLQQHQVPSRQHGNNAVQGSSTSEFHNSWFSEEAQSMGNVKSAPFSTDLANQFRNFEAQGFVLIKRNANEQSLEDISALEKEVLALIDEKKSTASGFYYSLLRSFNFLGEYSVRAPDKRYSIPLPLESPVLKKIFSNALLSSGPLLRSQLALKSRLVDLSSIISYPGSLRQKTHSDVPHSTRHRIISGFLALSSVSIASGPTCLFGGSHTAAFHRRHVDGARDAEHLVHYYSSSEESASEESEKHSDGASAGADIDRDVAGAETAEETIAINATSSGAPFAALLEPGDLLIYDSCLFHYGSANVSNVPRALLMFSFQDSTPWGSIQEVTGFTYNQHSSVKGSNHTLQNL